MSRPEELPPNAKQLLSRYREQRTPGAERQSTALAALEQRIAAGDPGADSSGSDGGAATAAQGSPMLKLVAVGAVVAGIGGALVYTLDDAPAPSPPVTAPVVGASAEDPEPNTVAPPDLAEERQELDEANDDPDEPELVPEAVEPEIEPPVGRSRAAKPRASTHENPSHAIAPETPESTLAEEMRLLGAGQRALNSGAFSEALRHFDEHRRRFPNGALAQERELKRIQSLCRLGRATQARAAAQAFAKRRPGTQSAERALAICRSKDEPSE
jgi:TolA-binding protein